MRTVALGGLAALMLAFGAQGAFAEPATTCVKAMKVTTPKKHFTGGFNDRGCTSVNGTHEGKYEKLASFTASEEAQLKALLKYVQVQASGVGGKPTVQFSGANVQILNGEGKTASTNGAGNLVLGYDEKPGTQTGSHDLIVGPENTFTSYGGIATGIANTITAPFVSVTGGQVNAATGEFAAVSGGYDNRAVGRFSWVGGGHSNRANGQLSSIFGIVSGGYGIAAEGWACGGSPQRFITESLAPENPC